VNDFGFVNRDFGVDCVGSDNIFDIDGDDADKDSGLVGVCSDIDNFGVCSDVDNLGGEIDLGGDLGL